jgi:hypothetical protein
MKNYLLNKSPKPHARLMHSLAAAGVSTERKRIYTKSERKRRETLRRLSRELART